MITKIMGAATAPNHKKQDSKYNELQAVYEYLKTNVATATMVSVALNIYRPSLCRRKRTLELAGHLIEVKKGYCKITNHVAAFLTTDPTMVPINPQFKMFDL